MLAAGATGCAAAGAQLPAAPWREGLAAQAERSPCGSVCSLTGLRVQPQRGTRAAGCHISHAGFYWQTCERQHGASGGPVCS